MGQEYTVQDIKIWKDKETGLPVKNEYGTKLTISFEELGEPLDMQAKRLPEVGTKEYGIFEKYTTKSGMIRHKFKRLTRPQEQTGNFSTPPPTPQPQASKPTERYWEQKNARIEAQMSIKAAVEFVIADSDKVPTLQRVEETALALKDMINRIAGEQEIQQAKQLAKSLDDGTKFSNGEPVPEFDEADTPINLSDIPF